MTKYSICGKPLPVSAPKVPFLRRNKAGNPSASNHPLLNCYEYPCAQYIFNISGFAKFAVTFLTGSLPLGDNHSNRFCYVNVYICIVFFFESNQSAVAVAFVSKFRNRKHNKSF